MTALSGLKLRLPPGLQRLKFMVAGENAYERRLVAEILKGLHLSVMPETEQPYLKSDLGQKPDIILWSWTRHRFDALERLMAQCPLSPPAVVLLIHAPSATIVEQAVGMGATCVIAKPFSQQVLLDHLALAARARLQDSRVML